jgi:hypothetical protein
MYKVPTMLIGEKVATDITREDETVNNFVGQEALLLEMADRRIFVFPYTFEDAIGRIFEIIPGGAGGSGSENSERTLRYITKISPKLLEEIKYQPITVVDQTKNKKGSLVLTAIMDGDSKQIKIELRDES